MTLQNEPQLSVEMEKKVEKILDEYFPDEMDSSMYHPNLPPAVESIFNLLATALEEQKQELLSEIKNRKATIKWLWGKQKTDDECFLMVMEQVQRIAEFAKLNQLKGGK